MDVKSIIYNRRIELGLTMKQLAELVGVNEGTISRWESGDIANMRRDKIASLAKALHLTPSIIMGWEEEPVPTLTLEELKRYGLQEVEIRTLPVLGRITCGEPTLANEEIKYITVKDAPRQANYVLIASGDSMINARIFDGDYVFIKSQDTVANGEIAAVIIENETTLKRVYFDKDKQTLTLMAENPQYPPLFYSGAELDQIRILGKAIAFQSIVK